MDDNKKNEQKPEREDLADYGEKSGVEADPPDFSVPYPFDTHLISIQDKTVPVQTLLNRLRQGMLIVPSLQRSERVWDNTRKSRLIESMMLRIPIPMFYASTDNEERWIIVDGLQRMRVIEDFVDPKDESQRIRLSELEYLEKENNGRSFPELDIKYQNRILETQLHFAIIGAQAPQEVIRNIFKRLNTGGMPLSPQEIRHALYGESSSEFLAELVATGEFKTATGNSIHGERMADRELILRLLAFLIFKVAEYPNNEDMDAFLSRAMQRINELPRNSGKSDKLSLSSLRESFLRAMTAAYAIFGDRAFRKRTPTVKGPRSPINKALFETVGSLLSQYTSTELDILVNNKEAIFQAIDKAMEDPDIQLRRLISQDTNKKSAIRRRFEFFEDLFKSIVERQSDAR